jgi:hypothetical protein
VNNQPTVHTALHPRALNEYFKRITQTESIADYNMCVDKIIQISPCYDLSGKAEKKRIPELGYVESTNKAFGQYNNFMGINDNFDVKQEIDQIDLLGDFKFDGGEI